MRWIPKPLGEILDPSGHHRAGDRDIPLLSITMKHGLVDQAEKFKKRVASTDTSKYRIAYKNELVVGFPIDEGVLGFQTKYPAGIVSPAYDVWKLKNETECHIPYLERYLRSPQARRLYASRMQGAVARRRSVTKTDFLKLEIPFPPLEYQIRIADLLGKVEGLIRERKHHLLQLDDLLKSVFLDIFGDPITNANHFPIRRLSEFYISPKEGTKCGPFGSALKKEELVETGVPVWNIDNINSEGRMVRPFRMWVTRAKYHELAAYSVRDGDIIISRAGTVGKMCVARMNGEPAIISTNLIRLRLGDQLRPLHFVSLMLYFKGRVGRLKTGADGAFTHMNTGVLDTLEFPYPPVELQDQFGVIAEGVERIKSHYQRSLTDLKALYGALSQRAFKGDLDLSRLPLPILPVEEKQDGAINLLQAPEAASVIELPHSDLLFATSSESVRDLLHQWLELYRRQLGSEAFSLELFMAAAQVRLSEFQPNSDFELGNLNYEHMKAWVFGELAGGKLTQTFDDERNLVQLKAGQV